MVEIKSVIAPTQYRCLAKEKYDSAYHWQLLFNMRECDAPWIDYISYCAEFPEDKQLFVQRLEREDFEEDFEKMFKRIEEFQILVVETKDRIKNSEVRYEL